MEQIFLETISRDIKDNKMTWKSQYDYVKGKCHLVNLIISCDEMISSVDEGRTVNVFHFVFMKAFCKIFHLPLEKRVRYELDRWIIQCVENWLDCKAQRFVICDKWHPITMNEIAPGNGTGLRKIKQFCRKDLRVNKVRHTVQSAG